MKAVAAPELLKKSIFDVELISPKIHLQLSAYLKGKKSFLCERIFLEAKLFLNKVDISIRGAAGNEFGYEASKEELGANNHGD